VDPWQVKYGYDFYQLPESRFLQILDLRFLEEPFNKLIR
jgi:hypothetical protein